MRNRANLLEKQKVLVLGNDTRSTLAVIRSLGRAGVIVNLGRDEIDCFCIFYKNLLITLFKNSALIPNLCSTAVMIIKSSSSNDLKSKSKTR
ncbi:hypothetical protein ES705_22495 [subsurface metagenome]